MLYYLHFENTVVLGNLYIDYLQNLKKESNLIFYKFIGSIDSDGRLEMPNVQVSHGGTYICQAIDYPDQSGSSVSVYLKVVSSKSTEVSS